MAYPVSTTFIETVNGLHDARRFNCRFNIYFEGDDKPPDTFIRDDIEGFNFDADSNVEADRPFGQIALKTLEIALNNELRNFTYTNEKSIYYGKLLAGTKVEAFMGLMVDNVSETYEEIPLGTFYTGDWDVASNNMMAKVTCYDRLYTYYENDTPKICVIQDTSVGSLFEIMLKALGIPASEIKIDESIYNIKVPYGWLPEARVKDTLSALCLAGACTACVSRNNAVYIEAAYKERAVQRRLRNSEQVVSVSQPQNMYKAYAGVTIKYAPTSVEKEISSVASNYNMLLTAGENKIDSLSFSTMPVMKVVSCSISDTLHQSIVPTSIGALSMDAVVTAVASDTADIEVKGYRLKQSEQKVTVDRTVGVVPVLKDKRLVVASPLIQTESIAKDYADILLAIATDPAIYLTASIMGDPSMELMDKVMMHPDSKATQLLPVVLTRITLSYNGGLSSTLECTKADALEKYLVAYMGPGFYTKSMKPK